MRRVRGISKAATLIAPALAAALILSACGGGGGGTSQNSDALTGTGPITLVQGKDTSGNRHNQIDAWNKMHPDQKVTLIELPEDADTQRQQMVQNFTAKTATFSVVDVDVVWVAEFAANQWIEQLPEAQIPTSSYLAPTLETAKYFNKLYAVPRASDGALLYYRKDLLTAAGVTNAPTTWADMTAACKKVQAKQPSIGCFTGQFSKYEGLTCNFSEAINSAGGTILNDQGKPDVNTPQAKAGVDFLVNGFKDGYIPKASLTYKEEESRRAFQDGNLVFERNWPYTYAKFGATDGSSKVNGKFAIAPLPGLNGPGVSTLGGHDLAISKFTKNKLTALNFIKFLTGQAEENNNLQATSEAPTWASLYDDPALVAKYPYLPVLKQSILKAKKRPAAVQYQDVSAAIQNAATDALTGAKTSDQALAELQTKLTQLLAK
ncbi:ABC transporter substrate-binding protein [Fodinicola feengrottensis]|uniref:ABC transporter substrate-binding protein n=1 Tax=Fodinicola feengrottensis TaxID=435914 RepID=A0ABN2I8N9_9ACTN|nr:ABC transporter substrate-binding protein [Fodinicola feengrottensis]